MTNTNTNGIDQQTSECSKIDDQNKILAAHDARIAELTASVFALGSALSVITSQVGNHLDVEKARDAALIGLTPLEDGPYHAPAAEVVRSLFEGARPDLSTAQQNATKTQNLRLVWSNPSTKIL